MALRAAGMHVRLASRPAELAKALADGEPRVVLCPAAGEPWYYQAGGRGQSLSAASQAVGANVHVVAITSCMSVRDVLERIRALVPENAS